jgi:hypothetical protein
MPHTSQQLHDRSFNALALREHVPEKVFELVNFGDYVIGHFLSG